MEEMKSEAGLPANNLQSTPRTITLTYDEWMAVAKIVQDMQGCVSEMSKVCNFLNSRMVVPLVKGEPSEAPKEAQREEVSRKADSLPKTEEVASNGGTEAQATSTETVVPVSGVIPEAPTS